MIRCERVCKTFRTGHGEVRSLDNLSLEVKAGEFLCVCGPSGCGKTTLLLTLGGMLRPTAGKVLVAGQDVYALSAAARSAFRASHIGFVFQMFHLVPFLNVLENVLLAARPIQAGTAISRATQLIKQMGLSQRLRHRPAQLSAGERQRTAMARALLNQPKALLADEPTGNLDPENAAEVFRHLREFRQAGGTVIVVTHSPGGAAYADRVLHLFEGRISSPSTPAAPPAPV